MGKKLRFIFFYYFSFPNGVEFSLSDDVLKAECALARQALPFAPAAQVLSVGPLGVHMTLCPDAAATRFVALLDEEKKSCSLALKGPVTFTAKITFSFQ